MAKIPFDIKFRPQIESGEYKVVNGDGRPVRIISWDKKVSDGRYEIVALVYIPEEDIEKVQLYCTDGTLVATYLSEKLKLVIVTPEPELTEFEKRIRFTIDEVAAGRYNADNIEDVKGIAKGLLELARKQLQPEIDAMLEDAYKTADEVMYRKGKEDGIVEARNDISARIIALKQAKDRAEEALKDLPRWKRIRDNGCVDAEGDTYTDCLCILKRGWYQVISSGTKVGGELQYLSIADLEKLPGFEEDE